MASVTGTCPKCHSKVIDKHCDVGRGPKCPWWRCNPCNIKFDVKGRFTPLKKEDPDD